MERKERIKAIWVAEQHVPTRTDCRFCDMITSMKAIKKHLFYCHEFEVMQPYKN